MLVSLPLPQAAEASNCIICYVIEPELFQCDDMSTISSHFPILHNPLSSPLPARLPKYQNLWVGIFPVENYHSLSYKYRGRLMAHCMIKTCAAAKQL